MNTTNIPFVHFGPSSPKLELQQTNLIHNAKLFFFPLLFFPFLDLNKLNKLQKLIALLWQSSTISINVPLLTTIMTTSRQCQSMFHFSPLLCIWVFYLNIHIFTCENFITWQPTIFYPTYPEKKTISSLMHDSCKHKQGQQSGKPGNQSIHAWID